MYLRIKVVYDISISNNIDFNPKQIRRQRKKQHTHQMKNGTKMTF